MKSARNLELKQFEEDFNKKLEECKKIYELNKNKSQSVKTALNEENSKKRTRPKSMISMNRKKLELNDNKNKKFSKKIIFDNQPPWIPSSKKSDYFEEFKCLIHGHELSDWEKVKYFFYKIFLQSRIGLCDRDYEKPKKRSIFSSKKYGEFNDNPNKKITLEKATKNLTRFGKKMITKFITSNEKRKNEYEKKEIDLYTYLHSKRNLALDQWKYFYKGHDEFSKVKYDLIKSYKLPKKRQHTLNNEPFKVPKINGDYFDKNIGIL